MTVRELVEDVLAYMDPDMEVVAFGHKGYNIVEEAGTIRLIEAKESNEHLGSPTFDEFELALPDADPEKVVECVILR